MSLHGTDWIEIEVCQGRKDHDEVIVRIRPAVRCYGYEFAQDATREGLEVDNLTVSLPSPIVFWPEVIAIALGSGGAGTALIVVLQKLLERHKGKKVTFGPEGQVVTIAGYSADDVKRVLEATNKARREQGENDPPRSRAIES